MVADGRIIAANSIIPFLWLQLHRDRLRAEWRRAGGVSRLRRGRRRR